MKFATNLRRSVYAPWKEHYLDYEKLKGLLREDDVDCEDKWSDEDESRFVEELINVQLENVNSFQVETHKRLRERTGECEGRLEKLLANDKQSAAQDKEEPADKSAREKSKQDTLNEVLKELNAISKETSELERFSRINFTGALKAAKKHDKRRGTSYRVRPLLQVRLAALPFNSEDYSPLLYQLSTMYTFVRQNIKGSGERTMSVSEPTQASGERYTSHKFFVHPENLLEVKTYILRHLPVLVYSPSTMKIADGSQGDPTITSLYFDNPKFSLYNDKIEKSSGAQSLRIQWFGHLANNSDLVVEKKTVRENDDSEIIRLNVKRKYVLPFLKGEYKMEKSVQKLRSRKGVDIQEARDLENNADEIQSLIKDEKLQPLIRTNYTRTAFQIPGEDKVRISIDTNLAMIREDSLDADRPCRDPEDWHRSDIDDADLEFPFDTVRKGEISRLPYAVLEIKVRDGQKKKKLEWVDELMSSHLVKDAPKFSKFVQGVASLFEDYVNIFPFWMSLLDTDIRRDPDVAFQEEQEKKAKQAENEIAVGSLIGSIPKSFRPATSSPAGKSSSDIASKASKDLAKSRAVSTARPEQSAEVIEEDSDDDGRQADRNTTDETPGLRSLFPSFSTSKYARAKRSRTQKLPPGVSEPGYWIKDTGPVKVEPKVWLANQRTFIKWEHISVLLATLSLSLYNAAGETNNIARALAVVYTLIAIFAGVWGWWMYIVRSRMIEQRSGKDFDNVVGPVVVCIALVVALCLNFGFKIRAVMHSSAEARIQPVSDYWLVQQEL